MRNRKFSMWKTYKKDDFEIMNEETRQLSMNAARYEVHLSINDVVKIQVRCRKSSKVYLLCEQFGFAWL